MNNAAYLEKELALVNDLSALDTQLGSKREQLADVQTRVKELEAKRPHLSMSQNIDLASLLEERDLAQHAITALEQQVQEKQQALLQLKQAQQQA
jgi:hypothetical protein